MAEPKLSVVVPTFNRRRRLERLLQSIEAQVGAPPFEVIVVDDGSTDGTGDTLQAHPICRYLRMTNGGPARARNAGWRIARGEVVVFTDDDVVPSDTWLRDMEAAMRDTGAAAVGGVVRSLTTGFVEDFVTAERLVDHGRDDGEVRFLVTANLAVKRSVLESVGGFDETFPLAAGEDTDLSFRLRKAGHRLAVVPSAEVGHDHRTDPRALLRTYHRHGLARAHLGTLHPDLGLGRQARSMMGPVYWWRRYRWYRHGGRSRLRSACFCVMRAVGLASYAAGVLRGRRRPWS